MANTKSAIKTNRRVQRQTVVNKSRKSRFRNAIKKILPNFSKKIVLVPNPTDFHDIQILKKLILTKKQEIVATCVQTTVTKK